MNDTENNPVWEVYDLYRTSRLNVKYYSGLLHNVVTLTLILDFIVFCTAPTSAVSGLWFWDTEYGKDVWKYLAIITAFAAIIKPLLSLPKKIKDYESLVSGYKVLAHDLEEIKILIATEEKYGDVLKEDFKKALKRKRDLVKQDTHIKENKRLKKKCEAEVLSELPVDSFFIPTENKDGTKTSAP